MDRTHLRHPSCFTRWFASLALAGVTLSCGVGKPPSTPPVPGDLEYQRLGRFDVFGVAVQTAGGNARIARADWNVDTHLGPFEVEAHYNSATHEWHWFHETTYDGDTFVSPTGAIHSVAGLGPGDPIPGTHWLVLGPSALATKGGLVFEFSPTGNLQRLRWQSGPIPRIDFVETPVAGVHRVTAGSQCVTATVCHPLFSVDSDPVTGRPTAIHDAHGRAALYDWDAAGNLTRARSPLDVVNDWDGWRYEYAGGALVALTSSEDERTELVYDANLPGRVRAVIRIGDLDFRWYSFDYGKLAHANATYVRDPSLLAESIIRFEWDEQYRTLARHDPGNEATVYEWGSASGLRVRRMVDPAGAALEWEYAGGSDDPTSVLLPSGNAVAIAYQHGAEDRANPNRTPRSSIVDALGLVRSATYDALGRLERETNGSGEATQYQYSEDLNLLATITKVESGLETHLAYDLAGHGHPTSVQRSHDPAPQLYRYDAIGNLLAGVDVSSPVAPGMPGVVARGFDANRNLDSLELLRVETDVSATTLFEPLEWTHHGSVETIQLEWRSDGRITSISRPHGGDTEFAYDRFGQLVERRERVDGSWAATQFEYSHRGQPTAEALPNGMRRETAYFPNGAARRRALLRDGQLEGEVEWVRSGGRLVEAHDSKQPGAQRYAYDGAGRVARIDYPNGEAVEYGYDLRSRLARESFFYDTGLPMAEVTYSYDLANRLLEVRLDGETLAHSVYEQGALVEEQLGNGVRRLYRFGDEELPGSDLVGANGELLAAVVLREVACPNDPYTGSVDCAEAESVSSLLGPGSIRESYELLPGRPQYEPGAGQRLVSAEIANGGGMRWYSHDALGNLTRRIQTGSGPTPGDFSLETLDFEYNAERNRLHTVRQESTQEISHAYAYDPAGFVAQRNGEDVVFEAGGRIERIGTRMAFVWDTSGQLISRTIDGTTIETRFGGRALDLGVGMPHVLSVGNITVELATGSQRYRHEDHRGNVLWVTDEAGQLVTQYVYGPYGLAQVLGLDTDPVRFARGTQLDDELVLLGARVYDQATGRFLSPDPLYQAVNQFAYAQGNPIAFSDPSGYLPTPCSPQTASGAGNRSTSSGLTGAAWAVSSLALGYQLGLVAAGAASGASLVVPAGAFIVTGFATLFSVESDSMCACVPDVDVIDDPPEIEQVQVTDPGPTMEGGCAPTRVPRVADPWGLLWLLVELQLWLWPGWLLLRRWAR